MYLVKTPRLIQNLFPNLKWSVPTTEQKVHLTFDDGPEPTGKRYCNNGVCLVFKEEN